ncbi:MAG: ATP-binding protein [Candidatus Omnitrophica bacterium]|nr:ATP-binding protein [Candidatus Omnitrophota bacterium]
MPVILFISLLVLICAGFIAYSYFINKRWTRELAKKTKLIKDTEGQLIHMEKMASLGTLAAGIAHEINNPLGFLISNLQSLKDYGGKIGEKMAPEDKGASQIMDDYKATTQEALEGAMRIKKIVSDLRTFSRRSETEKISVDMTQLLDSVLSIVWNEIKYKISVIKDYQAKTNILGDPTQLSQVFLNILINASQAIPDKGSITIATSEDSANIYIRISDTGKGIPADVLPKIFDPFFTTKAKGTGLGLSVTYNIIKHHGGDVKVESVVGKGTEFTVQLPKGGNNSPI